MATIMLDTDVYSFLTGKKDTPLRELYAHHVKSHVIALSFITVGEQYAGILRKIQRNAWPESYLDEFEKRLRGGIVVVPYDREICKTYGRLRTLKTPEGTDRVMQPNDIWIAASAICHSLTLVTHNRKHYYNIPGLTIISENPV